jgi:hypothetical protein
MRLSLPLERIESEADKVDGKKLLLLLVIAIPFSLGWLAAKTWQMICWFIAAIKIGWIEGTKPRGSD